MDPEAAANAPTDDRSFEQTLAKLTRFVTQQRRWPVVSSTDPSERRLAKWCSEVQRRRLVGALRPEIAARVEAVPGWTWSKPVTAVPYPSDRSADSL